MSGDNDLNSQPVDSDDIEDIASGVLFKEDIFRCLSEHLSIESLQALSVVSIAAHTVSNHNWVWSEKLARYFPHHKEYILLNPGILLRLDLLDLADKPRDVVIMHLEQNNMNFS